MQHFENWLSLCKGNVICLVVCFVSFDHNHKFQILYENKQITKTQSGLCSSIGIGTGYRLDGSGFESRWGRDVPHPSRPALGPTHPTQWVPGLFSKGKATGAQCCIDHPPNLAPRSKNRVELYLYST
jgi:hypothetical protein